MFKALLSFLSGALAEIFNSWRRDNDLRQDGANNAELESRKAEDAKVNAAIDAGNDPSRVQLEHDPQDRANRRKT